MRDDERTVVKAYKGYGQDYLFISDQLTICFDQDTILSFMNRTGRAIGVLYKRPYSLMVVDLVTDAEKNLLPMRDCFPPCQRVRLL